MEKRVAISESFGKLTDDDLLQIDGNADKMQGVAGALWLQ